ncbi:MAG: TetR family transcriptional regulator [Halioglobus sp.]|nr:TetR family transcriptional regulator [Halioglobus sp.]
MPSPSKREQIVDEALRLFYRHGFNATGVDKIIASAGVSKKTLYSHFRSKDELILATLRKRDEMFRNKMMRETERRAAAPRDRLLALFDFLGDWFNEDGFSGCMFINAAAEFSAQDNPSHMVAAEHKRLVVDYIREQAQLAGARDPAALAHQINLLMEGAIVYAHVIGDRQAATRARDMAEVFVRQQLDG